MKLMKIVRKSDAGDWDSFVELKIANAKSPRWGDRKYVYPEISKTSNGLRIGLVFKSGIAKYVDVGKLPFDEMVEFLDGIELESMKRFPDKKIEGWR